MLCAVDLDYVNPCAGAGSLDCNQAYSTNIGVQPFGRDIATTEPADLAVSIRTATGHDLAPGDLTVLSACPPCTDFSRAKPGNHRIDGERNTQVARCGRSEEHTSELQSLMRISYAVFCLKKKKNYTKRIKQINIKHS